MNTPRVLVPFDRKEAMILTSAAKFAGVSVETVRRWAITHDIGRLVVNRWMVSRYALRMLLDGEKGTLRKFLAGDRSSPDVRAYLEAPQ